MHSEVILNELHQFWHGCQRCPLGKERPTDYIVLGTGNPRASYLFVYEAPTESDVYNASPMNGKEGALLSDLLQKADFPTDDVFCTPINSCRPIRVQPATADRPERIIDREATKEERAACWPRLEQIIYAVDPLLIFTFGTVAWKALVDNADRGLSTTLDKAVGKLFLTRIRGRFLKEITYDVIPLLSPQQIIATPSSAPHGSMSTTKDFLIQGRVYVDFLQKTGKRDAEAAGFKAEAGR